MSELSDVTLHLNAGGRGSRLATVLPKFVRPLTGISKALLEPTAGQTLIDYQISRHRAAGVERIVAAVGDHAHVAQHITVNYAADPGVHAIVAPRQTGTGGDLLSALRSHPRLYGPEVLIKNCDTVLDIDDSDLVAAHRSSEAAVTIALTTRRGVPNQDAFLVDAAGKVIYSREAAANPHAYEDVLDSVAWRGSSTGAVVATRGFLEDIDWDPDDGPLSLYRDMVGRALGAGTLYAYNNGENFFIDVGTRQTWNEVTNHPEVLQSGNYSKERV